MRLRKRIEIEGVVQGVGFRPFVHQTAQRWGVGGWVLNDSRGVVVEVEGPIECLAGFLWAIRSDIPPLASISRFDLSDLPPTGETTFAIRASQSGQRVQARIAPDTYVCADCRRELFNPADRRFRYPFINCTNCGPRYSIVTAVPYDRPNTTMVDFSMCTACQAEYDDPASRRFHAQPNACPDCGPQVRLLTAGGEPLPTDDPLATSVGLLKQGCILAIKGLGGYHLAVDAENDATVRELRRRKVRDEKPFALMSYDTDAVVTYTRAEPEEIRLLGGFERPIVLLRQKMGSTISAVVAPNNRFFGVMLPYTPVHELLLKDNFLALVMTSGNLSDEPIAFEDAEAIARLKHIADYFLIHNRRIHTRVDDSISRVFHGKAALLRRSRGYVPQTFTLAESGPVVLGVGAELKSTICLTRGDQACVSQHIGDLKNEEVYASFCSTIRHLQQVLDVVPEAVAHDLHPDFQSTRYAQSCVGIPHFPVQHHHAHLASCLAENAETGITIGVILDGLGLGSDGNIWGGEFLLGDLHSFKRLGHLDLVGMPGGDAAVREPRRMAFAYLLATYGDTLPPLPLLSRLSAEEQTAFRQMLSRNLNSPLTSSCGRLFDAVAALVGLRDIVSYEGQAALELEQIAAEGEEGEYPFAVQGEAETFVIDWRPLLQALVDDLLAGVDAARVSARFHNSMAAMIVDGCRRCAEISGVTQVALSGGVFQNALLMETVLPQLRDAGFKVLTHALVPANDGGISLGQAAIARARLSAIHQC